jgi:hypothetical protein
MKYLCMIFYDEKKLDTLPPQEFQALVDQSLEYDEVLRKGNHLLANQALQPVRDAVTIRPRGGKMMVTDGPFAETREQIGGFILMEAKDREEAIRLASAIPNLHLGGVEVRPVRELSGSR